MADDIDELDVVAQMEQQQPTRTGKHREIRRFDKTQLKSTHHGRYVHRDYAAHFFRWGFIARFIGPGQRLLEVGCGQEMPLMYVLTGARSTLPEYYLGVDLNKVPFGGSPKWAEIKAQFNFVDDYERLEPRTGPDTKFDTIVCLEVIEHMAPKDGLKLLEGMKRWLAPNGQIFLSTPVYNGRAAVNHVHEYEQPELQKLIRSVGLHVVRMFGTFASKPEILPIMKPEHQELYKSLEAYYGGDVMSVIFAPLYPYASRNIMWWLMHEPELAEKREP